MIKYIGSKRTLVPALCDIAVAVGAETAVDLFTGTTRVAQGFKQQGVQVTAVDIATYSEVLAQCYVATNADVVDENELEEALSQLNRLPGLPGYFTETFCVESRFFTPENGARVDAIREAIENDYRGSYLYPILLTSLILAADRVDSTTGVQMAYLKSWAPRALKPLELKRPDLISGSGTAVRGDALQVVDQLAHCDLMYLDPPYNQHRYFTNYHIWESLVRWDKPEAYGIARKRVDSRDSETKSIFNIKKDMPDALKSVIDRARAKVLVVSYNDESWVHQDVLLTWMKDAGFERAEVLAFDRKRYVGAQIGIHSPSGTKVGTVGRLRNLEFVFIAGPNGLVEKAVSSATAHNPYRGD